MTTTLAFPASFPDDLVGLGRQFHTLDQLLEHLPEDREGERGELRARWLQLAVELSAHPFWDSCGNRTEAGYVLQQGVEHQEPRPAGEADR